VVRSTATALVLEAPRTLVAREFDLPEVGDDDGVLRVEARGLCGTDHEQFTGELHPGYPFVPGHETVGIVEAIGPRAADRWRVSVGDRVAVEVFLSWYSRERVAAPTPRRTAPRSTCSRRAATRSPISPARSAAAFRTGDRGPKVGAA